jgi:hypothetical protein
MKEGLNEGFRMGCTFQGDKMGEEVIEDASMLHYSEQNVLEFRQQFLTERIREDGDFAMESSDGSTWPADHTFVEDFVRLLFRNED